MSDMSIDRERFKTIKEGCAILGVSEATLRRWRRMGDPESFKVGKITYFDIEQLREFLLEKRIVAADNDLPNPNPVSYNAQDNAHSINTDIEDTYEKGQGGDAHKPPSNTEPALNMKDVNELLQRTINSIKVDNETLAKTTALATSKTKEIRQYEQECQELEKQCRKLNYYYIASILFIISVSIGISWFLYSSKIIETGRANTEQLRANQAEKSITDNIEEISRLKLEKEQIAKNGEEKIKLLERATEAEKKQLQTELSKIDLEKSQLESKIEDLTQQINAREAENLLLHEEINQVKIDKSDSKEADPNVSHMDGK